MCVGATSVTASVISYGHWRYSQWRIQKSFLESGGAKCVKVHKYIVEPSFTRSKICL